MVWGWSASPEPFAHETGAAPLVVQSVGVDQLQVASPERRLSEPPSLFCQSAKPGAGGGGGPPPVGWGPGGLAMPPPLRRQNASRFTWPPDNVQEWTYIRFSPAELCEQAAFSLDLQLSVQQVSEFFSAEASSSRRSPAHAAYAERWRDELSAASRRSSRVRREAEG